MSVLSRIQRGMPGLGVALILALAALPAAASSADNEATYTELRAYWLQRLLAPAERRASWLQRLTSPFSGVATRDQVAPMPKKQQQFIRQAITARFADLGGSSTVRMSALAGLTLADLAPGLEIGALLAGDPPCEGGIWCWPFLGESSGVSAGSVMMAPVPDWVVAEVAEQVRRLSLEDRRAQVAASRDRDWRGRDEEQGAVILAGPAEEGAATYRANGKEIAIRIPIAYSKADLIYTVAREQGWPLQLELVQDGGPVYVSSQVVVSGKTAIPVLLATTGRLVPATLTTFSLGGHACEGSNWLELRIRPAEQPSGAGRMPVWAVLFLNDPGLAQGVTFKSIPRHEPAPGESAPDAERREIELRWPGDRLPPLRIAARRFEWNATEYGEDAKGQPVVLSTKVEGSAWATQVLRIPATGIPPDWPSNWEIKVVGAWGSPRCPPP